MNNSNRDVQKGFLLCLQLQKCTAESAHAQLLKVTEGDVFSLDEVKVLFNEIDSGEYKKDEKVQDPKYLLQNMPYNVLKDIVGYLDLKSRLTLRKTSRQFRDFVDKRPFHIKKLGIHYSPKYIAIIVNDELLAAYEETHEKCLIRHKGELWLDKDQSFIKCVTNDFKTILQMKKLTVGKRKIVERTGDHMEGELLRKCISEVLSSREKKLKVEYLSMRYPAMNGLKHILPHLDPYSIKKLKFMSYRKFGRSHISRKSFGMDQWKNVGSFICNKEIRCSSFLNKCTHFLYSKTRFSDHPTVNDVMRMKEKLLLNNSKLKQIKIRARMRIEDFNEINRQLRTYNRPGTKNPTWAHFKYPNSSTKILSMCVTDKMIWFKGPCYAREESDDEDTDYEGEDYYEGSSDDDTDEEYGMLGWQE